MSLLRTAVAVAGGVVLLRFLEQSLQLTLVNAIAETPPVDEASYVAVRNQPMVLLITLVTHALAATLAGYILGRIAGAHEVRHATGAAALIIVLYALEFAGGGPMVPPMWVRVAILIITPPAIIAGAKIRADARVIQSEQAGTSGPEERS